MIAFACPGCGTAFAIRDELAGRKTKCPKCEKGLLVPALVAAEVPRTDPAAPAAPLNGTPPPGPAVWALPRGPAQRRWLIAAGVLGVGLLSSLLVAGWFFLQVATLQHRLDDVERTGSALEQQKRNDAAALQTLQKRVRAAEQTASTLEQQKRNDAAVVQALQQRVAELQGGKPAGEEKLPIPGREPSKAAPADDQAWTKACQADTPVAFNAYLNGYPEGAHAQEARQAIDDCHWREACTMNTLQAFNAYLHEHPQGAHLREARQAAEAWQWVGAARENTLAAFQAYLAAYSDGRFASEAKARIEALRSGKPAGK